MFGSPSAGVSPVQRSTPNDQEKSSDGEKLGGLPTMFFFLLFFSCLGVKAYVCHGGVLTVSDESFVFLAVPCSVQTAGTEN